jgi:hypothetical protein
MTDEELKDGVIACLRRAHFLNEAFVHGEEYIKKNYVWIEWDFERKLKRMTDSDWERHIKAYVEALKEVEHDRARRTGEGMAQ